MINTISKHRANSLNYTFTVLIPTWNNLPFLQLCIDSIQKNSFHDIQIIVIVNEGKDGTLEWLEQQNNIDYIHAKENIGICYGLNATRSLIRSEYIIYVNDDMYILPNWDKVLYDEIQNIGHRSFVLSATMIEPHDTGNPCVVVADYGQDIASFDEEKLLKDYNSLHRSDWNGSTWPPNVVHIDLWDLVGGLSIEFSPGMYSDPDFSRKLYNAGVRTFKGKGDSLVYHFGSKSTGRVRKNKGRTKYLLKWGTTSNYFSKNFLFLGSPAQNNLENPTAKPTNFINKIKRMLAVWKS